MHDQIFSRISRQCQQPLSLQRGGEHRRQGERKQIALCSLRHLVWPCGRGGVDSGVPQVRRPASPFHFLFPNVNTRVPLCGFLSPRPPSHTACLHTSASLTPRGSQTGAAREANRIGTCGMHGLHVWWCMSQNRCGCLAQLLPSLFGSIPLACYRCFEFRYPCFDTVAC